MFVAKSSRFPEVERQLLSQSRLPWPSSSPTLRRPRTAIDGHPERPARVDAFLAGLGDAVDAGRGARRDRCRPRARPRPGLRGADLRGGRARGAARRGHVRRARVGRGGAARGGRSDRGRDRDGARRRGDGGDAAARPPRAAGPADGLLPVRERRDRGPLRTAGARRRAHRRDRLGRPPRQRHRGDLLRGPVRVHRVAARVAALALHRCRRRDRRGRGPRRQPERRGPGRHRPRRLPRAGSATRCCRPSRRSRPTSC